MRKSRRKHWFVALSDQQESWTYAGAREKCETVALDELAWGCSGAGVFTYFVAPGHRSRKNREEDCDPEEYEFTVEMDKAERHEVEIKEEDHG